VLARGLIRTRSVVEDPGVAGGEVPDADRAVVTPRRDPVKMSRRSRVRQVGLERHRDWVKCRTVVCSSQGSTRATPRSSPAENTRRTRGQIGNGKIFFAQVARTPIILMGFVGAATVITAPDIPSALARTWPNRLVLRLLQRTPPSFVSLPREPGNRIAKGYGVSRG
jgi:hypothetical protein